MRVLVVGTVAVGTGLALGLKLPPFGPGVVRAQDGSPEVTHWVVIRPDDTVVIRIARSEMGQGTLTGLAQMVAEELECDWTKVTTEYPTPGQSVKRKRAWGDYSTGGSRGIRESHQYVREGGATARVMLIQAAADAWKVPPSECGAANSVITHKPSGRTTTYGKVAEAAARITPPKDVPLKDPKDWKIIGKNVKRLDTMDKLTGKQIYGFDLKLPGMLNAAIMECPVFGGKVKSFDTAKVASRKGVKKVMQVGDTAVAVIADTWWQAKTALDALPIVWDEGANANVSSASIAEILKAGLDADQAFVGNDAQAVRIAKEMPGVPVKLLWSREEDMRQGRFHPVTQCKLVGGFDANNNLTGLHIRISGQSILAAVRPEAMVKGMDPATFQGLARGGEFEFGYKGIPNLLIDHAMRNPHVPPGFWRGVNINQNAIYAECFMDELAHAAGQDALEFRRKLMANNPKHLAVLNAVAERAGWGKPAAKGVFRGLAQMKAFNSFVAACAEVSVEGGNKVKVHRIICATIATLMVWR